MQASNTKPTTTRRRREPGARRGPALVAAGLILVLSLLVTVALALSVRATERDDAETKFRQSANQAQAVVEQKVRAYFDKLEDIAAFVSNSPEATPAQFAGYVAQSQTFDKLPAVVGVLYLERVDDAGLDDYIARAKRLDPKFVWLEIGPHQPGTPRYVLRYYVPGNIDLGLPVGTDASPISALSNLVEAAGRDGVGVVGSFQADPLLQNIAKNTSFPGLQKLLSLDFFIGVPVYPVGTALDPKSGTATGSATGTVGAGGRPQPLGWIGAPVAQFKDVVRQAIDGQPEDLGLSLRVDLTGAGMGDREDLARVAGQEGTAGPRSGSAFATDLPISSHGVTFQLGVWSTPDADAPSKTPLLLLIGGAMASLLAAGVAYQRVRAHDRERAFAAEMADRAQFQREIVDSVTDPMVVLDAAGVIVAANPAWAELWAADREPVAVGAAAGDGRQSQRAGDDRPSQRSGDGHPSQRGHHPAIDGTSYLTLVEEHLRAGGDELRAAVTSVLGEGDAHHEADIAVETAAGRRWFAARATALRGVRGGAVVIHTDITERKRSHDELEFKASRDNLTGLLNRTAFEAEVDSALQHARAAGSSVGVLFIDLDDFKAVNDTYGHAVGDDVLRTVAQRVSGAVRTTDRVARLGGDEFVVLVAPLPTSETAELTAQRVLGALRPPLHLGDRVIPLGASVGVAVVEAPLAGSANDLFDRADQAMYVAKQSGGSRYHTG